MCGIAGILSIKDNPRSSLLHSLVSAIQHRGPDDAGYFEDRKLAFGMRRLSIIDVEAGHQPIFNEDGNFVIVFNGEIYNYQILRSSLEAKGHVFSTSSDTEVILHLYEEYGSEAPSYLRGMFAFAIWNRKEEELFIARDRFGIKPLFYFENSDGFYFSSEIKSFFQIPNFKRALDQSSALDHFSLLFTDSETTLFEGVFKLPPAHSLTIDSEGQKVIRKYYTIQPSVKVAEQKKGDRRGYLLSTLREVVRIHLLSDVPLGAYLSGGVDSSLLVALMKEECGAGIKTFSVGFEDEGEAFDERRYALKVARHLQTEHRELIITAEMVSSSIEDILREMDEPFANASLIPNYFLARFASEHVKVALSGLGGDEIAGGYERYRGMWIADKLPALASVCSSKLVKSFVTRIPDSKRGFPLQERVKRFVQSSSLPKARRYYAFLSKFSDSDREELFTKDFRAHFSQGEFEKMKSWVVSCFNALNTISSMQSSAYVDMHTYLVEDLLALSDRTSMAHSLELRVPFVDHELVNAFFGVPDDEKISLTETKILLKSIAADFLPRDVVYRRKQGFSLPINIWFRNSLRPFLTDVLSEDSLSRCGIFNANYIARLMSEHFSGKRNHDEKLFALMSFVYWCRENDIRV